MKRKIVSFILSATMLLGAVSLSACANSELEAKIADLQTKIEQLQDQNEDLQAKVTQQQAQIEELEQENQELKDDFNILCGNYKDDGKTFVVTDSQGFDEVFNENIEFDVDFDNEMLIVYTFGIEYMHPINLYNVKLINNILKINYNIELIIGTGSAVYPYQRWVVVKLDKLDITSVFNNLSFVFVEAGEENSAEQNINYNAKIYDNCGDWINESFKKNNRLEGEFYS